MSAQDEEDDRIDKAIADADWCHQCDMPIGLGPCMGCCAYASVAVLFNENDPEFNNYEEDDY